MGMAVKGDPPAADGIDQRFPLFTISRAPSPDTTRWELAALAIWVKGGHRFGWRIDSMAAAAAFAILDLRLLEMPRMAAPRTRRQSKRFVPATPPEPSAKRRLVLPEGDWHSIRSDLELRGWSSSQLELIQAELRHGWPLRIAVRHAAMRLGTCPTGSKALG
jgi:hypothetical protein